jgi:hypothetical protein
MVSGIKRGFFCAETAPIKIALKAIMYENSFIN